MEDSLAPLEQEEEADTSHAYVIKDPQQMGRGVAKYLHIVDFH